MVFAQVKFYFKGFQELSIKIRCKLHIGIYIKKTDELMPVAAYEL